MGRLFQYYETKAARARPILLGTLTILTLVGTFVVDIGTPDGVAAWAPYCIAIVLALQWNGAGAVVSVTATALILMIVGFLLGPIGDFQTATTNRAIGVASLTILALVCLYIDWRRSKHHRTLATTISRLTQLRLFVNSLKKVTVVFSDPRGRITEWSRAAQRLTGYSIEHAIGQPIFRLFNRRETETISWARAYRKARVEGEATYEAVYSCGDEPQRDIRILIKPLRNQVGRLRGYSLLLQHSFSAQGSE